MEPFRTKLEQVTFSPSQQSLSDGQLDSFSSVVSYDHELVNGAQNSVQASPQTSFQADVEPAPVSPSVPVSPVSHPTANTSSQWSYRSNSQYGEDGIVNIGYQVYFQSPLVQLVKPVHPSLVCSSNRHPYFDPSLPAELAEEALVPSCEPEADEVVPEAEVAARARAGVHANHADVGRVKTILDRLRKASKSESKSTLTDPTLALLTSTSEALQLQKAVVGSAEAVTPASPEDIVKAIAEAQKKLALALHRTEDLPDTVNAVHQEPPEMETRSLPAQSSAPTSPQTSGYVTPTRTGTVQGNGPGFSNALSPPATPTSPVSLVMPRGDAKLAPPQSMQQIPAQTEKELIRIPHSEIVVTKEGRSVKTYQVPNEDMKNRLRARARNHGKVIKKKITPNEHGSETRASTPSEQGDMDPRQISPDSLESSLRQQSLALDDSEVTGSRRHGNMNLDTSDLFTYLKPMSSSTPLGTPGKINPTTDRSESADLVKLLREKAHMQGQIEMLKIEAQKAMKDRSDLQAQLGAFKSQFKSSSGSSGAFRDRDSILSDLENVRLERDNFATKEQKLKRLLDEKVQESSLTKLELDESRKLNAKLQSRVDSNKLSVSSKDVELEELKARLQTYSQELQTLRQEKRSFENQVRSSQNELNAMIKTKEWYQQQLKAAQDTRNALQKDVSKMQINDMEKSSAIERLKSENTHIRQQLGDSQQRALQEKENLVKHLEKIEADMLEREAAVQQLQSDKVSNEGSLYERIKKVEEEKHQMAALVMTTTDLENELAKVRSEMGQKDEQIALLEREHAQMMRQFAMNQEMAADKQKDYEKLESRFVELEAKLKELISASSNKDSEILSLKDQKAVLEVALSSANEEKRTIDQALEKLRQDMETVENSFRMMKNEMVKKNLSLNELKQKNDSLESELNRSREAVQTQQKSFDEFNQNASERMSLVHNINEEKDRLKSEALELKKQVQSLGESLNQANNDKQLMRDHITQCEERINDLNGKLGEVLSEKVKLESSMSQANAEELSEVQKENTALRLELTEVQLRYNQALDNKNVELAALEKELWSASEKVDDLKAKHGEEMRLVGDRLKEASEARMRAEREVNDVKRAAQNEALIGEERADLLEQIQGLKLALSGAEADRDRVQTDLATLSHIAQNDADSHQVALAQLQRQLADAHRTLDEYKISKDESLKLALELEREKGRLSGVLQSHGALKQHTSDLEEALAEKESSLVDINVRTQQKLNEMSCHSSATQQRIQELERRIGSDADVIGELREQVASEKLESSRLQKTNESLQSDLDQTIAELEEVRAKCQAYKDSVTVTSQGQAGLIEQLEAAKAECDILRAEIESLRRQLDQSKERDPVVEESIKTLQWELDQKNVEMSAWREQAALADHRQQIEMDSIRKTLQNTKEEVDKLRSELARTRKDKFNYQAKLSELRGTVKACLRGRVDDDGVSVDAAPLVNGGDDENEHRSALVIIDKILDESSTPDYDSKPLAALHQCMTSLRSQMSDLQGDLDQHALAVMSSSQSWKQVESQVKELRDLCSSDDNSMRSDPDSVASSQNAEDLIEKLLANGKSKLSEQTPDLQRF